MEKARSGVWGQSMVYRSGVWVGKLHPELCMPPVGVPLDSTVVIVTSLVMPCALELTEKLALGTRR